VTERKRITPWRALIGPNGAAPTGDVCPTPVTIGAELQHLGRNASAVTAAFGGQDGRQAFAVGREVPT
jgi:hypothetical protein